MTPAVWDSWSRTSMVETKLTHLWTIDYFALRTEKKGEKIRSPVFAATAEGKNWCLDVYPKGDNQDTKDFVCVYLALADREFDEFGARVEFWILNAEGQEVNGFAYSRCYSKTCRSWGSRKFIERASLLDADNKLLLEGKFRIVCKVSAFTGSVNTSGQKVAASAQLPECRLSQDLGQLLSGGKFSDVVIIVDGREIRAHKSILAARSVVFAAMFEHDMEENKRNRVEITDLDYDVVSKMVQFIYSGSVDGIDEMAHGLLPCADKYALDRLKVMCEESLCSQVTVESAADLLMLAEKHGAYRLKATAIDFISTRAHDVVNTPGWKTLSEQRPQLIVEAFHQLAINLAPTKPSS